jgi:hypothetical protein
MTRTATLLMPALLIICSTSAADAPARFAGEPTVGREGQAVRIRFAADRRTDVAVEVLDAGGSVVRHLAAGVLGPKAPTPLQKDSFAQQLTWDGKDDLGRPAAGGPFRVRIGLGLRPALDRFIGFNPDAIGQVYPTPDPGHSVRAIATGPVGELYVFQVIAELHGGEGTTVCSVFSREGKYLRTILPYPANLPERKLAGAKCVRLADGTRVPFIYQGDTRSFVPGGGHIHHHRAVVTADGRVAFVGMQEWLRIMLRYPRPAIAQIVVLDKDGGAPAGGVRGPLISELSTSSKPFGGYEDRVSRHGGSLAASPDGRTLYVAGYREGGAKVSPDRPTHAVYRCAWTDREVRVFVGHKTEAGAGEDRLNTPVGVATDAEGNVYVADRENHRVAVFTQDGRHLGALRVERPERVEVHPKTGAVYVLGGDGINLLQKFSSWKAARPVSRLELPCAPHRKREKDPKRSTPVMALDASSEPAVLWFTPPANGRCSYTLLRVEDKGGRFGEPADFGARTRQRGTSVGTLLDLTIHRPRERLYAAFRRVKDYRVTAWHGASGKRLDLPLPTLRGGTGDVAMVGLDGNLYRVHGAKGWRRPLVARFDADLKPLPFPEGRDIVAGNAHVHHRGVTADARGNVYVLYDKGITPRKRPAGEHFMANNLVLYGPDGTLRNDALIDSEIRNLNSVRVDYAGNLYLAVGVRPAGKQVPEELKGQDLGAEPHVHVNAAEMNWYPFMYGCIVKFGPAGGRVRTGVGGVPMEYGMGRKTEIKGARWIHYGASVVASWRSGPPYDFPDTCLCEVPWFDVDGFGRSFFPDACRFRIGVLDTAGNLICTFGAYGNPDSAGPRSAVPTPAIPLCWPQAVAVSDRAAYVADRLNRRIVRVRLEYRSARTLPLP